MDVKKIPTSDIPLIVTLRQEEYERSFPEQFHPQKFEWNDVDDESDHLGVYHQDILISVLRLTKLDATNFEKIMAFPLDSKQFSGNMLALSRAATKAEWQGKGLHLLLRYYGFLQARASNTQWIFGTMEKSSPRIPLLERLGYEFKINQAGWKGWAKNKEDVLVASLDFENKGHQALAILHNLLEKKKLV